MKLLIVNNLSSGFGKAAVYDFMRMFSQAGDEVVVRTIDSSMDFAAVLQDVERFDENTIVLSTTMGAMTISGENLHIEKLSLDGGDLKVEGNIESLVYEENGGERGGFFARLMR